MKKIQFRQDPRLSRDIIILDENQLIVETKVMGLNQKKVMLLTNLSPDFEVTKRRFGHLYAVPLFFVFIMLVSVWLLYRQSIFPKELALCPAIAVLVFLWHAVKGLSSIEVTVIKTEDGKSSVEIFRPKNRAVLYDEFIATLVQRIRSASRRGQAL